MKESRMRRAILASLVAGGFAAVAAEPPLVSYRLSSRFLREPEAFRRMNDVLRRHPKAIDECWFGGGKPLCRLDVCVRDIARMAALKADAEAADVTVMSARGDMVPLATRPGDRDDEILVRVPNLGGWQILTVFCSASEEPGKGN